MSVDSSNEVRLPSRIANDLLSAELESDPDNRMGHVAMPLEPPTLNAGGDECLTNEMP